jgi:putative transposase
MRTHYPHHLPAFSYVGLHRYSLTFCTPARTSLFTNDGVVSLVRSEILRAAANEAFAVIAYCFMPDHLHLVVEGREEWSSLKKFASLAKQLSGFHYKQRLGCTLWQRYSYEHVVRHDESLARLVRYVLENPVRRDLVRHPREYPYLGSGSYSLDELLDFAYERWSG